MVRCSPALAVQPPPQVPRHHRYFVAAVHGALLHKHLGAFQRGTAPTYGLLNGPGEVMFVVACGLVARATWGLSSLLDALTVLVERAAAARTHLCSEVNTWAPLLPCASDDGTAGDTNEVAYTCFLVAMAAVWWRVLRMNGHKSTRWMVMVCLIVHPMASSYLAPPVTSFDAIAIGLHMTLLQGELVLGRMVRPPLKRPHHHD